jgi:hypothetical protein
MTTERSQRKAGFGARALLSWLVIIALVLSSAFSIKSHSYEHALSAQATMQTSDAPCDDDAGAGEHACHCACQHFGGVLASIWLMHVPELAEARPAALSDLGISITLAAPRRPPKA